MRPIPLIDLHQDLLLAEHDGKYGVHAQTNIELISQSPVKIVLATGFPDLEHPQSHSLKANEWIENDLDAYRKLCDTDSNWKLIKSASDLQEVFISETARGILVHVEGVNAITSEEEFSLLDEWYKKGLRSIGMVWNPANHFGGGAASSETLTLLGERLIAWCQKRGVIVDLAHMNRATFWAALPHLKRPPLVTHTGAASIIDSPRNLDDVQLRAIAEKGGVAGLFFSRKFTAPHKENGTFVLDDVLAHLFHMKEIMGADHIALGTDYGGALSGTPSDASSIMDIGRVTEKLQQSGWSEEDIEKLFYKNALRILSAHLS